MTVTYVVEYSYTGTNLRSGVIYLFFCFSASLVREGKNKTDYRDQGRGRDRRLHRDLNIEP